MKKAIISILFLGFIFAVYAGSQKNSARNTSAAPLDKGQFQLNTGVGFSNWGVPLYIGFDYGVHPDITIGGELSYRSWRENWNSLYYKHSIFGLSANGNYHFNRIMNIPRNWDFYAGLNIGYAFWSNHFDSTLPFYSGNYNSGLGLGAQIGGRYYFSDSVGINLEFGGGNASSGGKCGVSIRF